jgi:hypothetical protein
LEIALEDNGSVTRWGDDWEFNLVNKDDFGTGMRFSNQASIVLATISLGRP